MQIIEDRRALHRIPEIESNLPKTMAYLKNALSGLKCKLFSPIENSICAYFDFGKADTLAFRADCDALQVTEVNDLPYCSTHPGYMHACGHDGHMAMLLELARRLDKKTDLPHNALLIFQPAEENVDGAKYICRAGVLEQYNVKAIFGLHLWPGLEAGKVFTRKNELMARSCEVDIQVIGKSAHIGKASEGIDALDAGMRVYSRIRAMEQALPKNIYRLLNFGHFVSGTVRNAISSKTVLEGTLRTYQPEIHTHLHDGIHEIAKQVQKELGCEITVNIATGTPAVINPPELVDKVSAIASLNMLAEPSLTAEDFSEYQQRVVGLFAFLGLGDTPALHSANFNFDENILLKGADYFEELAEKFQ